MLTLPVVLAQLGEALLVNVKLVLPPAVVPVTVYPLTVATAVLLLTQLPPLVGDRVVVANPPPQKEVGPVMLTVGIEVTETAGVVLEQ